MSSTTLKIISSNKMKKLFFSSFVLVLLLFQVFMEVSSLDTSIGNSSMTTNMKNESDVAAALYKKYYHPRRINCNYACSRRCRESSRRKVCVRACGTCCVKCRCVPPGTYGNKHICPCYATLRTHGNKLKCP